jgi:outer membrane immunogenic protein
MKYTAWGIVSALALAATSSAFAADFDAPSTSLPVLSWMTGFYVGAELGGYGAGQAAKTNPFPSPGFGTPAVVGAGLAGFGNLPTQHGLNSSGYFGGAYVGYNWQVAPYFLLGAELHFDGLNRNINDNELVLKTQGTTVAAFNMLFTVKDEWLASARARVGWVRGQGMLYVTGGPAWTGPQYSVTATGATPAPLPGVVATTSWSNTTTGYAIGGGGEWMLSRHWLVRAEYVYYGFSSSSANLPLLGTAAHPCAPGACNWALSSGRPAINTAVAGVSYKFGP